MVRLQNVLVCLPAIIIALGFHEAAHAYVAYQLGDNTARNQGRLTINPFKHVDLVGLIMLVLFQFGWAKPVPINPNNFKNKKMGTVLTALAGPLANFIIAFVFSIIICVVDLFVIESTVLINIIITVLYAVVCVNVGLGVFNFIPIPPLDGSKILACVLPNKYYFKFIEKENILQLIMILLIFSGILGFFISPISNFLVEKISNFAYIIVYGIAKMFV